MRSSATKLYEIGDLEYEVSISYFHPGSPASYWEPADGPEVSPAKTVTIYRDGKAIGEITIEAFERELSAHLGPDIDVQERIEEDLIEKALDALEAYDD